jgi:hypothetical protein
MSTDRRTAANRANAALSTGPRSAHGKSVSSRNSTTHGLTSETLVVFNWESEHAFDALRQAFHARFRPLDAVEAFLVDRMVDTTWRRNRAIGIETTLFDLDISAIEEDIIIQMPEEGYNGLLRLAWAFRDRHGENSSIAIQRLITGIERSYSRARHELQLLQKDRFNNITVDEIVALSQSHEDPPEQTAEPPAGEQVPDNTKANSYNEIRQDSKSNPTATTENGQPDPIRGR